MEGMFVVAPLVYQPRHKRRRFLVESHLIQQVHLLERGRQVLGKSTRSHWRYDGRGEPQTGACETTVIAERVVPTEGEPGFAPRGAVVAPRLQSSQEIARRKLL